MKIYYNDNCFTDGKISFSADEIASKIVGKGISDVLYEEQKKQILEVGYYTISQLLINLFSGGVTSITNISGQEVLFSDKQHEIKEITFKAYGLRGSILERLEFKTITEPFDIKFQEWCTKFDFNHIVFNGIYFSKNMMGKWGVTCIEWKKEVGNAFHSALRGNNPQQYLDKLKFHSTWNG